MTTSPRGRTRKPADPDPDAPRAPRLDPEGGTPGERSEWGRSLRTSVPRSTWSAWVPAADRPDPVELLLRQLNDYKGSADVSGMDERRLSTYVEVCAEALARAHAGSGSASAIAGYLGKGSVFDKATGEFSVAYADQNRLDYEAFAAAAAGGRMEVRSGI